MGRKKYTYSEKSVDLDISIPFSSALEFQAFVLQKYKGDQNDAFISIWKVAKLSNERSYALDTFPEAERIIDTIDEMATKSENAKLAELIADLRRSMRR